VLNIPLIVIKGEEVAQTREAPMEEIVELHRSPER